MPPLEEFLKKNDKMAHQAIAKAEKETKAAAAASDAAAAAATNGHRRPVAHDTHRVGVVPQHTRAARAAW